MILSLGTLYNPAVEIQWLYFDPLIVKGRFEELFPSMIIEPEDTFIDGAEMARSKLEPNSAEYISERMLRYSRERWPAITFILPFEGQDVRGLINRHEIQFRCEGPMAEHIKQGLVSFLQSFGLSEIGLY